MKMFRKWNGNPKELDLSNLIVTSFHCESIEELLKEVVKDISYFNEKLYKVEIEKEWGKTRWFCRIEHTR